MRPPPQPGDPVKFPWHFHVHAHPDNLGCIRPGNFQSVFNQHIAISQYGIAGGIIGNGTTILIINAVDKIQYQGGFSLLTNRKIVDFHPFACLSPHAGPVMQVIPKVVVNGCTPEIGDRTRLEQFLIVTFVACNISLFGIKYQAESFLPEWIMNFLPGCNPVLASPLL